MNDWLIHVLESLNASKTRSLNIDRIFTRDERRLVSVAREGLIRYRVLAARG
jgi:acyl-CoA thioesterase